MFNSKPTSIFLTTLYSFVIILATFVCIKSAQCKVVCTAKDTPECRDQNLSCTFGSPEDELFDCEHCEDPVAIKYVYSEDEAVQMAYDMEAEEWANHLSTCSWDHDNGVSCVGHCDGSMYYSSMFAMGANYKYPNPLPYYWDDASAGTRLHCTYIYYCEDIDCYECEDKEDNCPNDPNKLEPGECGCGTPDEDEDEDGVFDCNDECLGTPESKRNSVNDKGCIPCPTITADKTSLKPGESTRVSASNPKSDGISFNATPEGPDILFTTQETADEYIVTAEKNTGSGYIIITATDSLAEGECNIEPVKIKINGCSSCTNASCDDADLRSIHFSTSIGKSLNGKDSGMLTVDSKTVSKILATPEGLQLFNKSTDVDLIREDGNIRQILAPEYFIVIDTINDFSYQVLYYLPVARGELVEGIYEIIPDSIPEITWLIENPDASPTIYNRLSFKKMDGQDIIKEYMFSWDAGTETWSLEKGNGLQVKSLHKVTSGDIEIETETISNSLGEIASKTRTKYKEYNGVKRTIEKIVDPDGYALTTTIEFYEQGQCTSGNCGRIKLKTEPDGSWTKFEYDSSGRMVKEIFSWLDLPPTASEDEVKVVEYDFSMQDAFDTDLPIHKNNPRLVTETIEGITTSKTFFVYHTDTSGNVTTITEQCTNNTAIYGDSSNLRTTSVMHPYGTMSADSGKTESITYPDGKKVSYTYEYGTYTEDTYNSPPASGNFEPGEGFDILTVRTEGTISNPLGIAHKTLITSTITDEHGRELITANTIYRGDGRYARVSTLIYELDYMGRVIKTHKSGKTINESSWGCCFKDSETDAEGITHIYGYDDLQRRDTIIKEGTAGSENITTIYTFDAIGRRLSTNVTAGALSVLTKKFYDTAGRLDSSIDEAGLITDYDYSQDFRTTTITRPGSATEISEQYIDGRPKSITGNGIIAKYYSYGVNNNGSSWTMIHIGSDTSAMWEKVTTDMLGRVVKQEKPGFSATEITENFYNEVGQLEKTTTTGISPTLYAYDELGNLTRSGQDIDDNGLLEEASSDRITVKEFEYKYDYTNDNWWRATTTKVFAADSDDTETIVSTSSQRLWRYDRTVASEYMTTDINNNQLLTQTIINRYQKKKIKQLTSNPDYDYEPVSETINGLLAYSISKTGVRTDYFYDNLGRRVGVKDARIGLTTTSINDEGRVEYIEDPTLNRTYFDYYLTTGRKKSQTNANGKTIRYKYSAAGQLTHMWGNGTEPVHYVYDNFGRLSEMHTYRNGSGWDDELWPDSSTGVADITKWRYQESTGLLLEKEDADGKITTYSYTPTGGKIKTRTWARMEDSNPVVTTYYYDPVTAELTDIDYSDTTPDISFSYDRLGRKDTITDAAGTRVFAYNEALQPETETITGLYNEVITRSYDTSNVIGRATGVAVGADYSVEWGYQPGYISNSGRLETITFNVSGKAGTSTYSYVESSDLLAGIISDTGLETIYDYEPKRNLKTLIQNNYNSTKISEYVSAYNEISQRSDLTSSGLAISEAIQGKISSQPWFDDVVNTGEGINVLPENREYNFDNIGNRTTTTNWSSAANDTQETTWDTSAVNRYDQKTKGSVTTEFNYDDDGNLLSSSDNLFTYDAENRLTSITPETPTSGSKKLEFVYDYMGRRVKKATLVYNGSTWDIDKESLFVYDEWNLIEEIETESSVTSSKYYVWGLDLSQSLQGAGGVGGLLASVDSAEDKLYYYLYEPNGNVAQVLDGSDGAVVASYEYDPFGNTMYQSGILADGNPFRFSTKYLDSESGLYYYGYRYYSADLGRWINRDPIGEVGFQFAKGNAKNYDINNRFEKYYELVTGRLLKGRDVFLDGGNNHYVFVKNNPMKFIDPEGLAVWLCNRPLSFVKKDPGKDSIRTHAFIWVDSVNTGYGLSTKHPILAALGDTVDGYIEKESSKGKDCKKIYKCLNQEKQILKYIQSEENSRFLRYNLYTLNCNHWATKVLQSVD